MLESAELAKKKKTTVYRLIVNNTVEDAVCEIANRKRSIGQASSQALADGNLFANVQNNDYTTEDVLRLFDLSWSDLEK